MVKLLHVSIILPTCFLLVGCSPKLSENTADGSAMLVPQQANQYVNVYKPDGDTFFGSDTKVLREGEWYDDWVPNDHCFVKADDGIWHIFGITHPYVDPDPKNGGIHQGEYASFHAVSSVTSFKDTIQEDHYMDKPKILPPSERPGEVNANHAPYIVRKDGLYHMVYGHSPIRLAVSEDLYNWKPKGELFAEEQGGRDPNLLYHEGTYYITYCGVERVLMRSSQDLLNWSEAVTILECDDFDPESPSLLFHDNTFYLFVCAWEGGWDRKHIQGAYTHKAYVYQSDYLDDFGKGHEKLLTQLNSHAPEIFQGEDGQWYISSVEWPYRGVSIDKLEWMEK